MKKVVSLLLVLVLALGMSTVAFAANANNTDDGKTGTPIAWADNGNDLTFDHEEYVTIANGFVWTANFAPSDFEWKTVNGAVHNRASNGITAAELDNGKIKVVTKVKKGAAIFDEATFEKANNVMQLEVAAKDPILVTSSDEVEFELEVYVTVNNKKSNVVTLSGSYTPAYLNPEEDDEGDDTSNGILVKPAAYNKSWVAQLDVDDTIEATCKLFKNRNFYIKAEQKIKDADAETADFYGFDQIYYLTYSANAVSSVQGINFIDLDKFYVYGSKSGEGLSGKADIAKDLVYLGTTADKNLPLYSKYYLSEKQVDVDSAAEIDEPADIDAPEPAPVTGGDGYIANVNDNPGTGK